MKIDRALNLIIPVELDDGSKVFVHSQPISLDTFNTFHMVLAKTFAALYLGGLGPQFAPRVAFLTLKDQASAYGGEKYLREVEQGLINEIRRLTQVVVPSQSGAQMLMEDAVRANMFDPETLSEIDNAIVFFSLAWRMHNRQERVGVVSQSARIWGGSTSSLNPTEYAASLRTSTPTDSSGENPKPVSSVPH